MSGAQEADQGCGALYAQGDPRRCGEGGQLDSEVNTRGLGGMIAT